MTLEACKRVKILVLELALPHYCHVLLALASHRFRPNLRKGDYTRTWYREAGSLESLVVQRTTAIIVLTAEQVRFALPISTYPALPYLQLWLLEPQRSLNPTHPQPLLWTVIFTSLPSSQVCCSQLVFHTCARHIRSFFYGTVCSSKVHINFPLSFLSIHLIRWRFKDIFQSFLTTNPPIILYDPIHWYHNSLIFHLQ